MPILLAALVAIVWAALPGRVAAHSDLQQAEPAPGASVPSPPAALRLRFTEPLDLSATRVVVADGRGERVDVGELAVGPPSDRLAIVGLAPLGEGVYTVRWWTLSQVDGHRWQGAYRFGVGRAPPAAAETPSPLPSPVELLVRWLALVATALVVGGLAFRAWALEPVLTGPTTDDRRPTTEDPDWSSVVGRPASAEAAVFARAAAGLRAALWLLAVASLGEFVATLGLLSSQAAAPDVGVAVGKAGGLALLRLALAPMIGYLAGPRGSTGMALAFAGMLVLTRGQAAHAATFGLGPILVDAAHQLVAAVWLGGAVQLALVAAPLARLGGATKAVVGRFSGLAGAAAGTALLTGLANALVLGLEPARLLESRYGLALAIKLVLVLGLIGVGALVWRRFSLTPLPPSPTRGEGERRPSRLLLVELVVGGGVLVAAGALALLPLPSQAGATALELVRPVGSARLHLRLETVRVGDVRAVVRATDGSGAALALPTTGARLRVTPLDIAGPEAESALVAAEEQLVATSRFERAGWWWVTVTADVAGEAVVVPFEVLVPDPNRAGVDPPPTEADAERAFGEALDRMERLRAVRQRDALADGVGGLVLSTAEYVAPDRFRLVTGEGDETVATGATQLFRRAGETAWQPVRRSVPFRFPIYRSTYEGATGQRLGRVEELAGVPVRVLSFYVPRDRAWYCWWMGRDDRLVRREAMIAPAHYMTSELDGFDEPIAVTIP